MIIINERVDPGSADLLERRAPSRRPRLATSSTLASWTTPCAAGARKFTVCGLATGPRVMAVDSSIVHVVIDAHGRHPGNRPQRR